MNPELVKIGDAELWHGDCREILPTLGEFDAIITDPPYGKVKGTFDHEWASRAAMLKDVDGWLDAIVPTLRANGTLWWFAWPALAGRIEAKIAARLNPLAHIVWQKPAATGQKCRKEDLRAPMPLTERILMAEHYGADNMAKGEAGYIAKCDEARGFVFEPLRAYLAGEMERAGHSLVSVNAAWQAWKGGKGGMSSHWFTSSQWALPTATNYQWLRELFNGAPTGTRLRREYEDLRREYEDLRREYEVLRREYEVLRREYEVLRREYEVLRRYFDCRRGDQFSDVWSFAAPTKNHGHPTEKPVSIMQYILRLSVRPGGSCCDPFMGSGTTGVACAQMGRSFTGIERERHYFDIACERIAATQAQGQLFTVEPAANAPAEQMGLAV